MKAVTERTLTTYCGIYCGDCPRYNAKFSDLCGELLETFESSHFSELARVIARKDPQFKEYDRMLSLLKTIAQLKCDSPCRFGRSSGESCGVVKCNKKKGFQGCWECDKFEKCRKLDFLKPFCGDAPIKNLRKIREYGIDNWAGHREKQYPWL